MISKLLPDQVAKLWPMLEVAIKASVPPAINVDDVGMNRILENLMNGRMDCWAVFDRKVEEGKEEETTLYAVLTTAIWNDAIAGTKQLLLYSFYGYGGQLEESKWIEALETLRKWAKSEGCQNVVAYTTLPKIVSFAKRLGWDTSTTFLIIPTA